MIDKITLTPLYGLGPFEPICYLLEFNGCRILLDCGWDYRFSDIDISNLKKVGKIDFIVISHSTVQHLGALPYAVAKLGVSCPIYATLPTLKMGLMFMYDAFQTVISQNPEFAHFTIEDVDQSFNLFVPLKYYQNFRLSGKGEGITITAMNVGNVIGGAAWKISHESDDIFYSVDSNHRSELHLDGFRPDLVSRPSVYVTDCFNFDVRCGSRSDNESEFIETVMNCLENGGEALIPTDAAGRSLELLLLLHRKWKEKKLSPRFSLAFVSHTAKHTIDFANSMLEWMSSERQSEFDQTNSSPFDFEYLRICSKLSDLEFVPKPRVILATNPFVENGFSQELFLRMAKDSKNAVILTQRAPPDTIAGKLAANPELTELDYKINEVERLKGEELEEYLEFKREEAAEIEQFSRKVQEQQTQEVEIIEDNLTFDKKLGQKRFIKKRRISQIYPMFPYKESCSVSDDYGEFVNYRELFKESDDEDANDVVSVEFSKKDKKFIKRNEKNKVIDLDLEIKRETEKEQSREKLILADKKNIPLKTITKIMNIKVNCKVKYINFEGRSDGSSMYNIISRIAPKKLILLHGTAKNAAGMKSRLSKICASISCPKISHQIDITSQSKFYNVVLAQRLLERLEFSGLVDGHKIAPIRAVVSEGKSPSGSNVLTVPSKLRKGENLTANGKFLLVGDLKLVELKNALVSKGIETQLANGEVLGGSKGEEITVKKLTGENIFVRGNISKDYFRIRRELYKLFKTV